jgi:hypothetical protein
VVIRADVVKLEERVRVNEQTDAAVHAKLLEMYKWMREDRIRKGLPVTAPD